MSFLLVSFIVTISTVSIESTSKPGASLAPLISTVANRTNNGEEGRGERVNGTDSSESGQARLSSRINTTASTVPPRNTSSSVQSSAVVSQASDPDVFSSIIAQLRRIPVNRQNENDAPSGIHMGKYELLCFNVVYIEQILSRHGQLQMVQCTKTNLLEALEKLICHLEGLKKPIQIYLISLLWMTRR